jgi:hemerythrin-like domain-containing protein
LLGKDAGGRRIRVVTRISSTGSPASYSRSEDVPDVLVDCHLRLREVTRLAAELAARPDASPEDVREVASKVSRYFTVALPLHEEDEEISLFPRLLLRLPALAPTIAALRDDHAAHAERVAAVLAVCQELEASSERSETLRGELAATASALAEGWRTHLATEERDLFPAVRTALSDEERAVICAEMRARRAHLSR